MSSLRVRNLIKRFSVNETESKFKSEAENQPTNQPTTLRTINTTSNNNNNNAMDASDSDSDVTDLERKIDSLAQQKKQQIQATLATNNNNTNGTANRPTNHATDLGVDVESSSEESKNSHVTEVHSVNDTSNYLTPSEVRTETATNHVRPVTDRPALTLAINGNMNYLTSTEIGTENVYYTPRDSQPENSSKDNTSKLGNTTNYLSPSEIEETRDADDTIKGNQEVSTNYLMPDEIQSKKGNIYHTSTNYLMPGEVTRDSDSESEDLTPVTRQNVNYLTKQEVDELEADDPKLEIKIDRANTNNITINGNAAKSRASTTIDPNNRRSVLYLQPSEIQFSDDDDDEHVFGAATLHVPKLALPSSPRTAPAKKGNVGYFESAPSRGSLQSAGSSATLPAVTPRLTARTGPNYTGPSTLSSLNSARDELEDSFSDDETDTWTERPAVSGSVPAASVVPGDSSDMYWNSEYQHVLAMEEGVEKYQRLSRLAQDFVYAAQTYGKIIITERYLPTHRKTIKNVQSMGGVAGGDKYKVQGILFKFAVDTNLKDKGYVSFDYWMYGGYRQSDRYAAKAAGHELKGLVSYYNATVPGLHYPLMALIDYRGFRLIAMSLVPVTSQTLKYGSADAGKTIHTDIPELNLKMEAVALRLNLKKHRAGDKEIAGPSDIEGHCSADNKFYVLDFARVFPPEAPLKPLRRGDRRVYYQLLRAELVRKNPEALNSDVFTNFNTHNKELDEHEVEEATLFLLHRVIPDFAAKIGKMSKVQLQKTSIIEEMHREGINIRHLGRVRALIDLKASGPRTVLLIEMIARVAKNKWRRMMRHKMKLLQLPSEDPYRQLTAQYLNLILGRDELRSERLWKVDLKRQIMVKFPEALGEYRSSNGEIKREIDEDYDLKRDWSSEDLVHLLTRVQELCGVSLSKQASEELQQFPRSISLLTSDIEAIQPRVKHLNVVEEAQAKLLAFQFQRATGAQATRLWALVNAKFRLAVASSTNSAETIYLWARVLFDQARRVSVNSEHLLVEARDKLHSCVELMPDKHVAWFTLGHVIMELSMRQHHSFHEQLRLYHEAAVAFRRAIQLDSSHVDELLQVCTENCRQITQITCSMRGTNAVALEELFKCSYQLFKLVLEHRFSERIYIQLGNLLLDWAQTKSAAAADEHYIRAAIMYEAALRCSPLLIDQGTRYLVRSRDQIDDHVTIKQIAPHELGLSKPNIASRLTTPRVESGTTQPSIGRSRENTISGGERPNLAMSDVVIKPLNLSRVAPPDSGKTLKASKHRPTIPLSQLTQSQVDKSQSSEEDTKHVIEHDKVVEIFAKIDGIWTVSARYELPKRKSDSWLWFNLLSTSSDTLALDSCRNMFMNDDTCTVIRRERVVNLCAAYEGTQFVLTRVTLKIPCDAVNRRGRIMVFAMDKQPKIDEYELFNDHTAESWKKFKVHVTNKRKGELIGEGNEPVTWIDLQHEQLTKNGNFYLVKKSIAAKKGKYLLIKIVNPPTPHDINSTAEISEDIPLTLRYMGFKGYQTLTPLNDTRQHVNVSITDLDTAQGLQLFDHVLEDQGPRLASVLRTIKCSPLLASLFIVLTRHKTKLGNAIFSPHKSSFCSVFYQPSRVVLPRVIPLHATNTSNDTNNTSLDLFLADCPAQVNLPLAKKLCQLFPNAIRSLDLAGADHLTDEAIFVFANSCQRLAHINLSKCPKISEQSVEYLLETKPGLKSLLLDSCTQFTDTLVASIAKFGMALEHLALWHTVSDKSLQQLSKCLNLKHLQLVNNHVISDKALAKLLKRLNLVSLNIDGCHSLNSNKTFAATIGPLTCEALTGHVHLTALSIRAVVGITDDTLTPVIEACPALAVLMADDCPNIGKHTVQMLGDTFTPVKALSLRRTTGWSDVDDTALVKLFLAFDKPRADWSEIGATKKNERKGRAATIARSSVKKKNRPALKIAANPSNAVQFSEGAPNMEILDLYRCNKLTDASISQITAHNHIWQSLRVLDLSYCAQITDQGLMQLSKCSLLEDLRLEGCTAVSSASLDSVVAQCQHLTRVNVSGCALIDGTVTLLATTHPNLEALLLSGCQDITDQSLSILGKCCPQLKVLHIRGNACVTDVALLSLITCCTALRSVDIADCKNISVLHDLVKLLPGCHFDT